MRGNTYRNVVAENIHGMSAQKNHEKWMNKQWKMCWKCQKDKSLHGGFLRISAGLHKFICKDCMDAKEGKA
jgi:hypothetical protein